MSLEAPWRGGFSQTRNWTYVSCHGRQNSYSLDHRGSSWECFKTSWTCYQIQVLKFFVCLLPQPQNWFLLTNLPCVHHLLFLSAYARPGNLLNTLSIVFPEPLSLGYDTAHCCVCSFQLIIHPAWHLAWWTLHVSYISSMTVHTNLLYSSPNFEPGCCSTSHCCWLINIQVSQATGNLVFPYL